MQCTAQCGNLYCSSRLEKQAFACSRRAIRGKMSLTSLLPFPMRRSAHSRPAKPRLHRLIVICAVAFAVLLLLLRMAVFVHGHGRR
jgi:hypothetical protein